MTHSDMQASWDSSWLDSANQSYLENQFENYLQDPASVSDEWRNYFKQLPGSAKDISHLAVKNFFKDYETTRAVSISPQLQGIALDKLKFAYRLLGHQCSKTNPLNDQPIEFLKQLHPEHYGVSGEDMSVVADLQKIYCGTAAVEFLHIPDTIERQWVQDRFENDLLKRNLSLERKLQILELIIATDGLEKYLGAKYPGSKRFSLEGCDSLLVALDEIITQGGTAGIQEIVIAMAHRGRLNVLVNILGKMPSELFDQFEDKHDTKLESGDVKYHQGFASDLQTPGGNMHVSLAFNPSHLEIVTPVATGSVRARQERRKDTVGDQVLCLAIHGDASFAGQGSVMETLNMSLTPAYSVGGCLHIIINNQIGFTTSNPKQARSTMYCSDIGKMLGAPIFHVNADDPEAMCIVAKIALDYRNKFHKDVIVDLIGYRRMGHNEADEPAATQPLMYKKIRSHPSVKTLYSGQLVDQGLVTEEEVERLYDRYRATLDKRDQAVVKRLADRDWKSAFASDWTAYGTGDWRICPPTGVPAEVLQDLARIRDTIPANFTLDPRVKKIIDARLEMTRSGTGLDWGYAETLAYASLIRDGYSVRISGQDCERGTFFHRHAIWHDYENGATYCSLEQLNNPQSKFAIYNSLLSEAAVLGFEYGYSSSEPRALTIWEAQFGDFANGAQVIIDQFISSGEQKWGRLSGLVLLLPHGYEGQGPEHSSARIERYLQLCAQHNIQVCIPSTPAQMFHMLRRQMLRPSRKPLIVITPKSLLRHKMATSSMQDLVDGEFQTIIADTSEDYLNIDTVILCSGKIYYELETARQENHKNNISIVRIEQIYPFPEQELKNLLLHYSKVNTVIWCQEEPRNQGAWYSLQHHLRNSLGMGKTLEYIGRPDSASPAVGYLQLHEQQQHDIVNSAILR